MGLLGTRTRSDLRSRQKEKRTAVRRTQRDTAWVRPDGGFAIRPCTLIDMSSKGARLKIDGIAAGGSHVLLMSRTSGTGKRFRIKWRRGQEVGVEFL